MACANDSGHARNKKIAKLFVEAAGAALDCLPTDRLTTCDAQTPTQLTAVTLTCSASPYSRDVLGNDFQASDSTALFIRTGADCNLQ